MELDFFFVSNKKVWNKLSIVKCTLKDKFTSAIFTIREEMKWESQYVFRFFELSKCNREFWNSNEVKKAGRKIDFYWEPSYNIPK